MPQCQPYDRLVTNLLLPCASLAKYKLDKKIYWLTQQTANQIHNL